MFCALSWSCARAEVIATGSDDAGGSALVAPTLAQALDGAPETAALDAELNTSEGLVRCTLTPTRTPHAVAMFVALARGRAAWRDKRSNSVTRRPMYRDLSFFRAIANVMVQTGCPIGNGTGHPGYRIPVESAAEDASPLSQPGALLLASYHPAPNRIDPEPPPPGHLIGSQFVITLTDMSHLAGKVSVIGTCQDLTVVQRIAQKVIAGESARLRAVRFPTLD